MLWATLLLLGVLNMAIKEWNGDGWTDVSGGQGTDTLMGGRQGYAAPVSGTWAAKSSSPFGASRDAGTRKHAGNDLQASNGSEAVATIGGKVIYAGHNQGYQWNAVILGDDGNAYRYATHGPLSVKPGERVEQGQPVGTIARSHLHFEVIPPGPTLNQMVAAAAKNSFVGTSWRPGQDPTTQDPAAFFDMDRGESIHAGDMFEEGPTTQAARLAPEGSPALGSRLGAEMDVPASFPTLDETVQLLADRGYSGQDAVMRFQADQMGLAGDGGRTSPEFFAALTNDMEAPLPSARPDRGLADAMVSKGPSPITSAARTAPSEAPVPNPTPRPPSPPGGMSTATGMGGMSGLMGAARPPAPSPEVAGVPTPKPRPAAPAGVAGMPTAEGYRRLRLGSQGEDVMTVQGQLAAAGYDPGPLDGAYGPKTARAVMEFQQAAEAQRPGWVGGKVDAIAGPFTQAALFEATNTGPTSKVKDPGGVPGGSPSTQEMGRTFGMPMAMRRSDDFSPASPSGLPPGTVPAGGRPAPTASRPPMASREVWDSMGLGSRGTPETQMSINASGSKPFEAKPWSGNGQFTKLGAPIDAATMSDIKNRGAVGITVGDQPSGSTEPAPLSPTAVIGGMGGTGSSGLGFAGPGGPGPGSSSSSNFSNDDDDEDTGTSGYNESFSTTGWL